MEHSGELLKDIDFARIGKSLSITALILPIIRQLILAVCITTFTNHPIFSVFFFNFLLIFYLMFYIWVMPSESRSETIRHIGNEITLLGFVYHQLLFTPYIKESQLDQIGNSAIYLVLINIGFNLLINGVLMGQSFILWSKKEW